MPGAADSLGVVGPVMCRRSPWTLLRRLYVDSLDRFCPAREWIGAADPIPCCVMHRPCSETPRITSG
jgi:hypothetical protein